MDERSLVRTLAAKAKTVLRRAFLATRDSAGRRAKRRLLVIGDSHVRVFEHPFFLFRMPRTRFEVVYVAGGSAIGILNPKSVTGARMRFDEALARGPWDVVLINLGEVDTAYTLWRIADVHGQPIPKLLDRSVEAYVTFLDSLRASHRLIVLAATLPTLGDLTGSKDDVLKQRSLISATQRERTDLTLEFNRRVGAWCLAHGVPHLDTAGEALGPEGLVKSEWTIAHRRDHHYERSIYARWIIRALRPLL